MSDADHEARPKPIAARRIVIHDGAWPACRR